MEFLLYMTTADSREYLVSKFSHQYQGARNARTESHIGDTELPRVIEVVTRWRAVKQVRIVNALQPGMPDVPLWEVSLFGRNLSQDRVFCVDNQEYMITGPLAALSVLD